MQALQCDVRSCVWRICVVGSLGLAACSPPQVTRPEIPPKAATASVWVHRPTSFSNFSPVLFGENDHKYLALKSNEYGKVDVVAGRHHFEAWAHYGWREEWRPHGELDVELAVNTTTCINAYVNEVKALVAPRAFSNVYDMEAVSCNNWKPEPGSQPSNPRY